MADMIKIKRAIREGSSVILHVIINENPMVEFVLTPTDSHGLAPSLRELFRIEQERGKIIVEESV